MDKLLNKAEQEMLALKQPYVGSHHLFLAYLNEYKNDIISYDEFKNMVIKIIGCCQKQSPRILYTPYMRELSKNNKSIKEAIKYILEDDNSIVHNILISRHIDIDKLINSLTD